MEKSIRRSLLKDLEAIIKKTQEQIQPLLQEEQVELGNEKLEKFHRENPHRYAVADAIYKRFRQRQEQGGFVCSHVKGLQPIMLKALGYDTPDPVHHDYNIGWHILPDGKEKIWCLICGQPFSRKEAEKMLKQSSNKVSASEHLVAGVKDGVQVVYQDRLD